MTIRAVIVDDEPIIARDMSARLAARNGWIVCGTFIDSPAALTYLKNNSVDICFLDIEMPGLTGLDFAERLAALSAPPQIVFVTAHPQHGPRAFRMEATDYLLKPVSDALIHEACTRVEARVARRVAPTAAPTQDRRTLAVRSAQRVDYVPVDSIIAAKGAGNYALLISEHGEYLHRTTLTELAAAIEKDGFLRTHRSHLVNTRHIRSAAASRSAVRRLELTADITVPVSPRYRASVARALGRLCATR